MFIDVALHSRRFGVVNKGVLGLGLIMVYVYYEFARGGS